MIMPGIMVLPVQSKTFADAGIVIFFEFPVLAIFPLMITIAWSFFEGTRTINDICMDECDRICINTHKLFYCGA